MTTATFSHATSEHTSAITVQAIREFLTAWFQATPVYALYCALND